MIKNLKKRVFRQKNGNKMSIDLGSFFIYNYYGVNSGMIFPKAAATLCKSKNLHMRGAKT